MISACRWLVRFTIVMVLAAGLGVGAASAASAHDVLISSNPVDGATLRTVPSTVSFTFDQPVQNFDPVVSLIGPDGKQYATGAPQISGNVVTGNVAPVPAGAYIAAYRIVSADGHPVTGEVHFTLAAGARPAGPATAVASAGGPVSAGGPATAGGPVSAGGPATAGSAQAAVTPPPNVTATGGKSGGLSAGIWIALIVAALVLAAAAIIALRRPSGRPSAGGTRSDKDY